MYRIRYEKDKNYLFVDAYNMINFWPDLVKLKDINLEDSRICFIDKMIEFSHFTKEKIILVFDAYLVKGSGGKIYKKNGIVIVFTKENERADHYIERELDMIGRLRNVRVATSDATIQEIILSRGGTRISARELLAEVENSKKVTKNLQKKLKEKNLSSFDKNDIKKLKDLKNNLK